MSNIEIKTTTVDYGVKSDNPNKKFIRSFINNNYAGIGKRIIVVFDFFDEAKLGEQKLINWKGESWIKYGHGYPDAAEAMLEQLCSDERLNVLTEYPLVPFSLMFKESGEKEYYYKEALGHLRRYIYENNFDGIVFAGFWGLDENFNSKIDPAKFGRVFDYKIKDKTFPCIYTISPNYWGTDKKSSDQEDFASLVGFFKQHLEIVMEGKNRYTVDGEGWQTTLVRNIEQFDSMMEDIRNSRKTAWDCETTGLSRKCEKLLTLQVATGEKTCYVLPFQHKQSLFTSKELKYIADTFKNYFEREAEGKIHVYQNAKYDIGQFITHFNLKYYAAHIWDLMAGEFALNENRKFLNLVGFMTPYTLEFISYNYGGGHLFHEGKLGKKERTILADENIEDIAEYGAKDVIIPYQICSFQIQEAKRRGDKGFVKLVADQMSDMILDFAVMESNGIKVDKGYLLKLRDGQSQLTKAMQDIEDEYWSMDSVKAANGILLEAKGLPSKPTCFGVVQKVFDINKQESQQALFFKVLGIAVDKARKDGGGSIGKAFKEKYKGQYHEVELLDKYDKIKKIKSTFIDAHFDRFSVDPDLRFDSRMRSSYQFTGVVTGRASSSNPNLQQVPSRGEFSKLVKRQFICDSNHLLVKADYSAHEVRNWGNVSKDENVCQSFDFGKQLRKALRYHFAEDTEIWERFAKFQKETRWKVPKGSDLVALNYDEKKELIANINEKRFKKLCELIFELENKGDVHKLNYEFFYGTPAYLVNPQQRQSIKAVVFGVIYGMSAITLAEDLKIPVSEAEGIVNKMFEKFPLGGKWINHCKENGKLTCQVRSPLGRIRHLDGFRHPSYSVVSAMERKGPNSCIQGFASDIGFMAGKILYDLCWHWFWKHGVNFEFSYNNVVHDSTECECRIKHIPIAAYMIEHAYTTLVHLRCRDLYGLELVCGYEIEMDIGGSYSHMDTYENFVNMEKILREQIEWTKENIPNWTMEENELEDALYNYHLIQKYRREELKQTAGKKVDYIMLLNEDNIRNIGLRL